MDELLRGRGGPEIFTDNHSGKLCCSYHNSPKNQDRLA